ncbi:MAG: MFS transporter [Coxiellaceae bacterium]|nr:MFS transporter [Coxiellaceae bacterium]
MDTKKLRYLPWIVGFGMLMETLDVTVINTAIPQMSRSLMVSPISLKIAITSYLLSLAAFMPISGFVADRIGTKVTFAWAMVVFILGSILAGCSVSVPMLVIGRIVQGVGGAMMTPVGRLVLLQSFPKSEFAKAFSLYTIFGQIGPALGPVVGGALTTGISWRMVFFINIPIGIIALFFIHHFIDNQKQDELKPFDISGFIVFGVALALLIFALTLLTEPSIERWIEIIMLAISAGLFVAYYFHYKRVVHPVVNLGLFRTATFRVAVLGSLVIRMAIGAIPFLLPLLFQLNFGLSAFQSGLYLVSYGVALICAKPLVSPLIQRVGYQKLLIITPILISICLFELVTFTSVTPIWWIVTLVFIIGFFCSLQFTFMNTLNFVDIKAQDKSAATSVSSVMQQFAMSLGVCVAAGLLLVFGGAQHGHYINQSVFKNVWLVLGCIPLLSLIIFGQLRSKSHL